MKDDIGGAIPVCILLVTLRLACLFVDVRYPGFRTAQTEAHGGVIHRGCIEIGRGQDGDGDNALFVIAIDTVGIAAGFDIDFHRDDGGRYDHVEIVVGRHARVPSSACPRRIARYEPHFQCARGCREIGMTVKVRRPVRQQFEKVGGR